MDPTLILIGGPPRVGKSTIARVAALEIGCGWMSLDVIRGIVSPLIRGYDDAVGVGIPPFQEAELFFPHLERGAGGTFYLHGTHVLEGVGFMPEHVTRLSDWIDRTAIFLGARTFDLDAALRTPGRNRWIEDLDETERALVPAWIERWSHEVETQCVDLGIPYIDTSDDFDDATSVAVRTLTAALDR
jgi:hypothetical protein